MTSRIKARADERPVPPDLEPFAIEVVDADELGPTFEEKAFLDWKAARKDFETSLTLPGSDNFDLPETIAAEEREADAQKRILWSRPTTLRGMEPLAYLLWDYFKPHAAPYGSPEFEAAMEDEGLQVVARIWQVVMNRFDQPVNE